MPSLSRRTAMPRNDIPSACSMRIRAMIFTGQVTQIARSALLAAKHWPLPIAICIVRRADPPARIVVHPLIEVTRILCAIRQGDSHAAERLLPLVYDELRKLAAQKLAQEKPGQTLQATALVHEVYLRLVDV